MFLHKNLATLRVLAPDRKGIVAACSELLNRHDCSIVSSEHYSDLRANMFFQRLVFEPSSFLTQNFATTRILLDKGLQEIRTKFALLKAQVDWFQDRKRVAVMVSKQDHCLWELLLRHEAQELNCDIPIVISNHQDCRDVAETFNIPYHVFEITAENKVLQEAHQLDLLKELKIDVVVLARYMQVLTSQFLQTYPECIINIHHSFLPAFSGSRAYHKAHERGVKLIGATAHYATEELDEGPIITQDVIDVTHRDQARDYIRKGRILERTVLVNAVQAHLENRILVYNNKCVVFSE